MIDDKRKNELIQFTCSTGPTEKYKDFRTATGYGTGHGLCGWNCYHKFFPFIEGVSTPTWTPDTYSDPSGKTNDQVYEESQMQRALERKVRESRRECAVLQAGIEGAQSEELKRALESDFSRASNTLGKREQRLKAFCDSTGRKYDGSRVTTAGYTGRVNSAAVKAANKANSLTSNSNSGTMSLGALVHGLGAASMNKPRVENPDTGLPLRYVLGKRPEYPPDHTMAGYRCKTGRQIDDVDRLVREYNAPAEKWQKEKARYWVYDSDSEERQVELHWYQHEEVGRFEHKIKLGPNGEVYVDEW